MDVYHGSLIAKTASPDGTDYTIQGQPFTGLCGEENQNQYECKAVVHVTVDDQNDVISCKVELKPTSRVRELKLSPADLNYMKNNRRLAISNGTRADLGVDQYHKSDPFEKFINPCVVYHCFVGDKNCDEPSSNEYCLAWMKDMVAPNMCAEPLCRWYLEDDKHPERRWRRLVAGGAGLAAAEVLHMQHPRLLRPHSEL